MKKCSGWLTLLVFLILMPSYNVAAEVTLADITVYMDQKKIQFNDTMGRPFIDKASRTQMPFRQILEAFGATVTWDDTTKTAIAVKKGIEVRVPIGERYIIRNTEVMLMDTASVLVNGRSYIPLRAVMEAFGSKVYWNAASKRIDIVSPKPSVSFNRLPDVYDLRSQNRLTEVRNQAHIGACWAFATLGALESCLSKDVLYDFSEDHMSLTHGYNLSQNDGGDFQISLAYLARWSGPVYESEDAYGDGYANLNAKAVVHVQEAKILPKNDLSAIKRSVMTYGGVQASIHIDDIYNLDFGDAYNPETTAFNYKGKQAQNHDIVIVGWDDYFEAENFSVVPSRSGAFICRNSYGDLFGEDGYFYVSYEDAWIGQETIVYTRIEKNTNYDNIYQTDWLGWVGRIGYGKESAYIANVYTTKGKEQLEAVSFYATDRDTSYEVYVVPTFTGVKDFDQRQFVTRGTLDYVGYYTIDFNKAIEVNGDYAVVVKITTPDSLLPVAAEFYKDVPWLSSVDITDGRGYMSHLGKVWESTEATLQSNIVLKAFTSN